MVLSKDAVTKFLARDLRDSSAVKDLSEAALDAKLEREGIEFTKRPRWAQKICVLLGWRYTSYLFLMGMGGGKTFVTLTLFRNYRRIGEVRRMLVLVPNVVNLGEWVDQVEQHAKDCSIKTLSITGEEARRSILLDQRVEIVVATYAGMGKLCSSPEQQPGKQRRRWKHDPKKTDAIAAEFDMLVLDESTAIKNEKSLFFRFVRRMRKTVDFCYGLTGTPFDKDPIDLWSQFYAIDEGETLGETLGLFREAFFRKEDGYWGTSYVFRKKMDAQLSERLGNCSIRFTEDECQDLPESVGGIRGDGLMLLRADMPKEQAPYYQKIATQLSDSQGDYALVENAYTRMRMVSSGWLGARDEESDERVEIVFKKNPKLDAIVWKLREIGPDEGVIIVHWFNTSGKLIAERLKKEKMPFSWIYGKTTALQKKTKLERFKRGQGPRILLASTAISKGVNLQDAARYMLFFESPDSVIERQQMEARIRRESEVAGPRYFYDAVCSGTIDEKILRALCEGKKLLEVIVDRGRP